MSPPAPLPESVIAYLRDLDAPARLTAHLRLVHDVARRLLDSLAPLPVDRQAVLFGAATHDIGKVRFPEELSRSGHCHEEAGYQILVELGVEPSLARFARTHGAWREIDDLEDLLVSLADKIWRGKREAALETKVLERLVAGAPGSQVWEVYGRLDNLLSHLAASGDRRLAYQMVDSAT